MKMWFISTMDIVLYGCNQQKLSDKAKVYDFLKKTPSKISMETCIKPIVTKHDLGLVGVSGIMTSHIALVTIPSKRAAYGILSTCKHFDDAVFRKYIQSKFDAESSEYSHNTSYIITEKVPSGRRLRESGNVSCFAPEGLLYAAHGYFQCTPSILNDEKRIKKMLIESRIKSEVSTETKGSKVAIYKFQPQGITAALTNPRLCMFTHTWPELSFAEVDILSQSEKVINTVDTFVKEVLYDRSLT